MDNKIVIAVIAGTTRQQRKSIKAAQYVAEFGRSFPDTEVIFVDPKDFNLPGDGNDPEGKDPRYTEIVGKADAFFVVTPEYNHSFPGSLKRLLDSELQLYNHKPVAMAGVSDGNWGGVRAVEALVPAVRETGLVVLSFDVYFPRVQDIFDEDGKITPDFEPMYTKNLGKVYEELLWMARVFKEARAKQADS